MKAHAKVSEETRLPAHELFEMLLDLERLPGRVGDVQSVEIVSSEWMTPKTMRRVVDWKVKLRGAILKWTEESVVDVDAMAVEFVQRSGDLESFEGSWNVKAKADGCVASLTAVVNIGVPLLAPMLNPVAVESLESNFRAMILDLSEGLR